MSLPLCAVNVLSGTVSGPGYPEVLSFLSAPQPLDTPMCVCECWQRGYFLMRSRAGSLRPGLGYLAENVLTWDLGLEPATEESLLEMDTLWSVPGVLVPVMSALPCQVLSAATVCSEASLLVLLVQLSRYHTLLFC